MIDAELLGDSCGPSLGPYPFREQSTNCGVFGYAVGLAWSRGFCQVRTQFSWPPPTQEPLMLSRMPGVSGILLLTLIIAGHTTPGAGAPTADGPPSPGDKAPPIALEELIQAPAG